MNGKFAFYFANDYSLFFQLFIIKPINKTLMMMNNKIELYKTDAKLRVYRMELRRTSNNYLRGILCCVFFVTSIYAQCADVNRGCIC